ncbi:MAG TPA: DUF222 domain-containing protein [Streptosporangiaceae bacterium]|nr:DUF222 domain-containing protein [Streptosporangiaceae bacterium]
MCSPDQAPGRFRYDAAASGRPGSVSEALAALQGALGFLADADATALTASEQAECLRGLERAESARIAARSLVLAAFTANGVFEDDGHRGPTSWLRWQTRITGSAAAGAVAWMRRLSAHPAVRDALADGTISVSWAREICDWTDLLPAYARADADAILLAAAAAGAALADLAGLAEELRRRTAEPDQDGDDGLADRAVRLDLHYRGAGKLTGDLTPRCAAALRAVLDALGKKAGPEDTRTSRQRDHDAIEEACRRLIAAGLVPDRAGQPTQIQLVMTLDQLLGLTSSSPAGPVHSDPAVRSDPAPPGPLARPGDLCDASIAPVVTGHVDHELLDRLARTLLASGPGPASGSGTGGGTSGRLGPDFARELILRNAVALLSGPGGLASRLRTGLLTGPAASISLPLDLGTATDTVPPYLRRAIILRDKHCSFPGCTVPAAACQVHHLIPVSEGGPTTLDNCTLGCPFHHLIAIHELGWKLVLNADGTTTAISPDRSRVLRSHDPP